MVPYLPASYQLQRGRARAGAECLHIWDERMLDDLLQRGRARAGAECQHNNSTSAAPHIASTGPRPRGRGMQLEPREACDGFDELQRGRARAGAECLECSYRRGCQTVCFNGAAPARARNVGNSHLSCLGRFPLQRGRARAGAEWRDNQHRAQLPHNASTGPRPRGRGMILIISAASRRWPRFNGAAPARARNVALFRPTTGHRDAASTGPRPRGRGM